MGPWLGVGVKLGSTVGSGGSDQETNGGSVMFAAKLGIVITPVV